jgi:hypothetical protein
MEFISKAGFTSFNGHTWRTYLVFGFLWVHIEKNGKYPWISFERLPF